LLAALVKDPAPLSAVLTVSVPSFW
jgi:hypothetical protein